MSDQVHVVGSMTSEIPEHDALTLVDCKLDALLLGSAESLMESMQSSSAAVGLRAGRLRGEAVDRSTGDCGLWIHLRGTR